MVKPNNFPDKPRQIVWAKNLTRRPPLVVYVKFQLVYTTTSQSGSQLLLASASSNVQLGLGSEKAFEEYLGISIIFSSAALVQIWLLIVRSPQYQ